MMRLRPVILFAVTIIAVPARGQEPPVTVYVNARVYTADDDDRVVGAFAVKGDRFVKVGARADMAAYEKAGAKVVDLNGAFVVPGLTDAHFHGTGGGENVSLADVRSMPELIATLRAAAAKAPADRPLLTNGDWHEAQLKEERKPTVADLDKASTTVPIVMVRGGHSIFLNSAALRKYNITTVTPVPAGGSVERGPDGELTGELVDAAKQLVPLPKQKPLSEQDLIDTQRRMNAFGVTAVRVPGAFRRGSILDVYAMAQQMEKEGRLTLRYTLLRPGPGRSESTVEALKTGPQQNAGNEWVRIGGIKLFVDGGFEGAHFSEPYAEPYGKNGTYYGIAVTSPEQTREDVVRLNRNGWNVAIHAAGDEGINQALSAMEAANAETSIKGRHWSIEHGFIVTPDQIKRMKALGVAASLQDHQYLAGSTEEKMWGHARAERVTPAKDYWNAGLLVVGGTDAPVIPDNPFWSMYYFASRESMRGRVYGVDQAITSRTRLIRMFTINFARLIDAARVRGSIEPEKLADFAVLDTDLLTSPVAKIRHTKAIATYVGGRRVYEAAK